MTVQLQVIQPGEDELAWREAIIEQNLRSFLEVGQQLMAIRDGRLYRPDYASFEDYLRARWPDAISKVHATRVIVASEVVKNLVPIGTIVPLTEAQARPLTALPEADQRVVWRRVLDEYEPTRITAKLVQTTVDAYLAEIGAGAPRTERVLDMGPAYSVEEWGMLDEDERRRIVESAPLTRDTRFNRTNENVEWSLWTWNPVTGCLHDCAYCYARDIANHYYTDLPDGQRFEPYFRPSRLHAPRQMTVPAAYDRNDPTTIGEKNVFTGSMTDLFGKWVPQDWIDAVFGEVVAAPEWNFLFLTKFPQRLAEQRWPGNAWCGTTVDRQARVATAERSFRGVTAGVKWLSCEPLLERLTFSSLEMFDWVVIGASSRSTQTEEFQPPWEWVEHLMRQARDAGCKVYVKPNLLNRPREYPSGAIEP